MKRFVSLLAVAALAITFGAACGGSKCSDGDNKGQAACEKIKEDNATCKWTKSTASGAKANDGKCALAGSASGSGSGSGSGSSAANDRAEAQKVCAAVTTTAADCTAKSTDAEAKDAKAKCEWDTTVTPNVCKASDK